MNMGLKNVDLPVKQNGWGVWIQIDLSWQKYRDQNINLSVWGDWNDEIVRKCANQISQWCPYWSNPNVQSNESSLWKEKMAVATDLISLCLFCNVSLTVSISVLLTTVLPANSLWPVSSCSGKHGSPRPRKNQPRCRDSSRKGRNHCIFKLKCHPKSGGNKHIFFA